MSVCPLLTLATAVFRISCWFLIVHLVKIFTCIYTCHGYSKYRECDSWAHKPGLIPLSMICSPGPSVELCALSVAIQWNLCFKTTPWAHKRWSYITGGLLSEVQILQINVYVPTKVVLYDRWSLITVVFKHRFHCSTSLNWPIISLLSLLILFSNVFCILLHDYTLCFTGSPCHSVRYYNYISIWSYYIVIHSRFPTRRDSWVFTMLLQS